ncbi:hypothetical protein ZHAS_00005616 [Anopheles sinensis]|uniref:Ionotropic glutamate receptor C-terminal domain-containing protein n=1 Tax=Anopheles sinensis TaxID=74873 RepID=A0A084VJZ0_ANOSI|nr:hypothetical protein ZHAS_00005616 [Anopheles sinensis]
MNKRQNPLDDTVKSLVKWLESNYPVTISQHDIFHWMYNDRDASLVLMDASGLGTKLTGNLVSGRLDTHECYSKLAKFIVLVESTSNKSVLADVFGVLGITNYLIVPLEITASNVSKDLELVVGQLYTKNHFSNQEDLFDIDEHNSSSVGRYFPDKLNDVFGYRFYMIGSFEFPYLIYLERKDSVAGLMVEAIRHLVKRKLNGTLEVLTTTKVPSDRSEHDVIFALTRFPRHFSHDFTLLERGGRCLLCPFRTERDFMSHLLKPFSVGIWIVLGTTFVVCRLLNRLFPASFQRDLIEMVFFGSGGYPHRKTFPTRIVSFGVVLLVFFLSEAYIAKIVSLMSVAKYYERPETVQELNQSKLLIANPFSDSQQLAENLPGKVLSKKRAKELYQQKKYKMFGDYCTVEQCFMAMLFAMDVVGEHGFRQYVMRELVEEKVFTLQLARHSPFYETFVRYLLLYFESGMWMFRVDGLRDELNEMIQIEVVQFERVIFHFDDLFCIWVLIMVGWWISLVCFIGEVLVFFFWNNCLVKIKGCRE